MTDLEGKELEVGTIYIVPGSNTRILVAKFTHETKASFIFKQCKYTYDVNLRSYNRNISKWLANKTIPVVKVSQELIDRYNIS